MTIDPQECRSRAEREQSQLGQLRETIAHAKANAPFYQQALSAVDPAKLSSLSDLAALPVTRKSTLSGLQASAPPFGGFLAAPFTQLRRVFQSPGPIYEPQGMSIDHFGMMRALRAAGFQTGDLVHNSFSYHLSPGAWIIEGGLHALGCWVLPAGIGQTEQQVQAIAQLKPVGYTGTPSFLKILIEKGAEMSLPTSSLRKAMVSGEALTPSTRQWLAERNIRVGQAYATADLGMIAYETADPAQGMVMTEDAIVEIVEPGGSAPMPLGEVGEVVVTTFNREYPMIRFATGDLSAIDPQSLQSPTPCGRTNLRIKGWLGRADQTTKVRGMFVHPGQVGQIIKNFPDIKKARLILSGAIGSDIMTLHCEAADTVAAANNTAALIESAREITRLRCEVKFVAVGSLPEDGKQIEDARSYA
ncbi:MAG: phenylacetate--CoA ligase family protein [Betaproteobacteria bacterium]|jgi:phenylacetate-CoA ligase|nr:phenylacetate--CoA ligase family protein [Betaproteobacteria bacterium]